jgi:isopenicillin N synthase-like dioxygenase
MLFAGSCRAITDRSKKMNNGTRKTGPDLPCIPTINLEAFIVGTAAEQRTIAAEVDEICRTTGFLVIERHGLPDPVITEAWTQVSAFFDLPLAEKLKSRSPDPTCPRGYFPMAAESLARSLGVETPPDLKESFGIGPLSPPGTPIPSDDLDFHYGPNLWPAEPGGLRPALTRYFTELQALGSRVLRLFAAALDLPHDYFERFHTDPMCALRCIRYPAQDGPVATDQRGAGEHSDYGSITLLKPDPAVAGLEIRLPSGRWAAAPLVQDAFIVNIGDMMARWTNDRWVSTRHRVVAPGGSQGNRQSIAFFHNTSYDASIECIPTCSNATNPPRYAPVEAGQYLYERFTSAVNYA